jgi:uncharacterized protein YqeY
MTLKEIINERWKEAFKNKEAIKRTTYEFLKQKILTAEKSGKFDLPLSDEQITNLIIKEYKEREDLLTIYKPEDEQYITAKGILAELEQYLPKQMSEEEVIMIIKRLKETEPNIGKLIGLTVKEVGNRFDKSKIATLVKNL